MRQQLIHSIHPHGKLVHSSPLRLDRRMVCSNAIFIFDYIGLENLLNMQLAFSNGRCDKHLNAYNFTLDID